MTTPENAVAWALRIANDPAHGYDQGNRWGPDYDCSSLVISAYEQAGLKLRQNGASYTGNMRPALIRCGFREVDNTQLQPGDVLLNEENHTALYIGNGQLVQASHNEKGAVVGGQPGDQTGREIAVVPLYNYPWDCVLRYEDVLAPDPPKDEAAETRPVQLPTLRRGNVGSSVLSMQLLLIHKWAVSCGIDGADGDFGRNTESAVRAFQTHRGLDPDGVVGPLTWVALIGG